MKKICLAILGIVLIGITTLTIYTLTHQHIEGAREIIKTKSIEKASSNMTENELSEIYNIQLNGKRHKLKTNYRLITEEETTKINLTLYLDGFEIKTVDLLNNLEVEDIEEALGEESSNSDLIIEAEDLQIINDDKLDYILVDIASNIEGKKEEYYVWSDNGKVLLENILVQNENITYISPNEDEELTCFYDEEKQVLAKVEDNVIYALEEKEEDEKLVLEEYSYKIKNGKIKKDLLNTYEVEKKEQ